MKLLGWLCLNSTQTNNSDFEISQLWQIHQWIVCTASNSDFWISYYCQDILWWKMNYPIKSDHNWWYSVRATETAMHSHQYLVQKIKHKKVIVTWDKILQSGLCRHKLPISNYPARLVLFYPWNLKHSAGTVNQKYASWKQRMENVTLNRIWNTAI